MHFLFFLTSYLFVAISILAAIGIFSSIFAVSFLSLVFINWPLFLSLLIIFLLLGYKRERQYKVLDSSTFVDGRIVELIRSRFLEGPFLIPKFIIGELHRLSDSDNNQRRMKGRRALDNIAEIQRIPNIDVVIDRKNYNIRDVDTKLVKLTKKRKSILVTTDFNLTKVAEIESIKVLNLNTLSSMIKKIILPNEELEIELLKKGDKDNQAIGYLEDGTMVVVANALSKLGSKVKIAITTTYPTQAGRIIFGKLK